MAKYMVDGVSNGLSKKQRMEAVGWITSDPARLESLQEQFASIAPRRYRRAGWANDLANERTLAPLPFGGVAAQTLTAHGANDSVVPSNTQ